MGTSIIDRRHSAADGRARENLDATAPTLGDQVDAAMVPARVMADDNLKLAVLQHAKGDLDVAQLVYDDIVDGRDRSDAVPLRAIPDDVLLSNVFGAVDGDLDAYKAAAAWVLS